MQLKKGSNDKFFDLSDTILGLNDFISNDVNENITNKKSKENVDPINLLQDWEIYERCRKNNKIKNALTNERLVKMIQNGYEEMWEVLYKKTEKSIHNVYHKKVHDYYKSTMNEDVYSALHYGWTNAVLTYNETKATAPFVAYASYLMYQQYVMLVRKIKPDRIGKSVRHEYLENTALDSSENSAEKQKDFLIQNILVDKSDCYSNKENAILLSQALKALKKEKEDLYDLIILHYIKGIPQTQIALIKDHGQSYISRKIKQGVKFLQDFMLIKSKGNIDSLKLEMLSSFK